MRRVFSIVTGALVVCSMNTAVFAQSGSVAVTVTTKTYNGQYAPRNSAMMWVQKSDKTFIKTIKKFAAERLNYMTTWNSVAKGDVDGLSGATRSNHNAAITANWDLTGQDGKAVAQGTYEVWVEFTENNGTGKTAKATVEVGATNSTVTVPDATNFTKFTATYTAPPVSVNSNVIGKRHIAIGSSIERSALAVTFPNANSYTISILSPNGKSLASSSGYGANAMVNTKSLAKGLYIVNITYAGQQFQSTQFVN
ncbi:MAG: DUF2271 domain-containing protein [Fibrobacterota bacterium]|nr:DUF2271 domain-containing protein [Chitinispirillaceae bacterium]